MVEDIQNIWFAIPALSALTIQLWLITHSDKRRLINKNLSIMLFFIGVLGVTSIEFCAYAGFVKPNIISMKLFYVFWGISLGGLLNLSMKLSSLPFFNSRVIVAITLLPIGIFSVLIFSTDLIIAGIQSIGYSTTRLPGKYYFIAQFYGAFLIISTFCCLLIGAQKKEDSPDKKRAKALLLSTTPFLFVSLSLIVLMSLGFKINASLVMPLALTFMLVMMIVTERREQVLSLLLKIPYTRERRDYKQITSQIENFLRLTESGAPVSLKSLTASIEQQIVSMAVQMANGSQVKAASLLNVSASSICRKKKAG